MILLIDNYDSFTYNLYQKIGQLYEDIKVVRNDMITIEEMEKLSIDALIISPGPGYPKDAGISIDAIKHFSGKIPILGICLGHQGIGEAFGGKVIRAKELMHGKASEIIIRNSSAIFKELPSVISAARYHSLIVEDESLPNCLMVLAEDSKGQIMALKHKDHPTYGLQFHPESILTELGTKIIENFLQLALQLKNFPVSTLQKSGALDQKNALKPYLFRVIEGKDLREEEASLAMHCIMDGESTDAQIGSFITALRMKGETVGEIIGCARAMREKGHRVFHSEPVIDIVGTGGDRTHSFNISTTSSFVIAGTGAKVAKHGNRSVSSKSGAADMLESLGFNLNITPDQAGECLKECGISFLFAPIFHRSMRFAVPARKEVGIRSVFNILGPLANPADADHILLGVYDEELMEKMAQTLMQLGSRGAMIVHSEDGMDEVSVSATTKVYEIREGKLIKYCISPEEFGIQRGILQDVVGGTSHENADITLRILEGYDKSSKRDIVLMNSGCALYVAGKAKSIGEGIEAARISIDNGKALEKMNQLRRKMNSF